MKWQDPISEVRGIGPVKAEKLNHLGISRLEDALSYYPRDYEDRTHITPIAQLVPGEKSLVRATLGTLPQTTRVKGGMRLTRCRIFDESGSMEVVWFQTPYAARGMQVGREYDFYSRVQQSSGRRLQFANPEWEPSGKKDGLSGRILPIYSLCAGITRRDIEKIVTAALSLLPEDTLDWVPDSLVKRCGLLSGAQALRCIHQPQTMAEAVEARRRLLFEEMFLLACGTQKLKARRQHSVGIPLLGGQLWEFYQALPFTLTDAQKRVIEECAADLASVRPMNRLVQGDVGSGKTMVAAAACYLAASSGAQAAVMVPTEILARQHAQSMTALLRKLGISCGLLVASMSAPEKRQVLADLADGSLSVVIGTHALIQDSVRFQKLGLMVADEQHRFGVRQRMALTQKGAGCNILVMSATPIPRSLALMLYGDLDLSVIDQLPPGRQKIRTFGVGEPQRRRIYAFMEKEMEKGGQVYVVCPAVEESELEIADAQSCWEKLQGVFPNRRIGLVHGRMKGKEKDAVMTAFAKGELDILVATTVIEVGVDVPNATLIVVENGERFGLSQLHQLRGRVGRGSRPSYAVFFGADKGEKARERLKILCQTHDGFRIAQADLAIRGPGDLFGDRQHGESLLKLADAALDMELMENARLGAEVILDLDPTLEEHPALRERVERMFTEEEDGLFN